MVLLKKMSSGLLLGLLCGLLAGCAENPGTWPEDKVAAKIQEKLELTDLQLTARPEGGYEGQGTRADGETLTIVVTQDADAHRINWDAQGDRGLVEEGFYELK